MPRIFITLSKCQHASTPFSLDSTCFVHHPALPRPQWSNHVQQSPRCRSCVWTRFISPDLWFSLPIYLELQFSSLGFQCRQHCLLGVWGLILFTLYLLPFILSMFRSMHFMLPFPKKSRCRHSRLMVSMVCIYRTTHLMSVSNADLRSLYAKRQEMDPTLVRSLLTIYLNTPLMLVSG